MKKYKLVHAKKQDTEHLCDKVTIDGFDYYLDYSQPIKVDKWYISNQAPRLCVKIKEGKYPYIHLNNKGEEIADFYTWKGVIICSNNPNIDIPKVVNEVEKIADEWFLINGYNQFDYIHSHRIPDAITTNKLFKTGYNKSQETHPFSEQDMLDFVLWKDENKFSVISTKEDWVSELLEYSGCVYTTKELLQPWKEQQPKVLFYE